MYSKFINAPKHKPNLIKNNLSNKYSVIHYSCCKMTEGISKKTNILITNKDNKTDKTIKFAIMVLNE